MKRQQEGSCGDGIILYCGCMDVSILNVLLYYLQDVTMGNNWVKK